MPYTREQMREYMRLRRGSKSRYDVDGQGHLRRSMALIKPDVCNPMTLEQKSLRTRIISVLVAQQENELVNRLNKMI